MNDTTAGEIIVQAFREGKFLDSGESTAEEMFSALPRLNALLHSVLGIELGEKYRDWPIPPRRNSSIPSRFPLGPLGEQPHKDTYLNPPQNVRILASNTAPLTVYFPYEPDDGARMAYADVSGNTIAPITLDGNGRLIQGRVSIQGQGGNRRWFYRADLGNWICLNKLGKDDELPLPPEFDDMLISGLALRLASRYGREPDPLFAERYRDALSRLRKRYAQSESKPTTRVGDFPRFSEI